MELFSPGHLIPLLIVVAVLFFGWKQLPDMSRSLGRSLRIFKTEMKSMSGDADDESGQHAPDRPASKEATAPKALSKAEVIAPGPTTARPRPRPAPGPGSSRTE